MTDIIPWQRLTVTVWLVAGRRLLFNNCWTERCWRKLRCGRGCIGHRVLLGILHKTWRQNRLITVRWQLWRLRYHEVSVSKHSQVKWHGSEVMTAIEYSILWLCLCSRHCVSLISIRPSSSIWAIPGIRITNVRGRGLLQCTYVSGDKFLCTEVTHCATCPFLGYSRRSVRLWYFQSNLRLVFKRHYYLLRFKHQRFVLRSPSWEAQSWGARPVVLSWNLSSACLSVQKKFGGRARGNEWNSSDDWYAKRDGKANVFPAHSCTTFVVTSQDLFLLPVGSSLLTSGFCLSLPPRVTDYRSSRDKHEAMKHMSFGLALKPLSWPRDVHNHYHMYANVWHHGTQSAYLFKLFKITQTVSCNTGHENTIINTSCHVSSSCLLDQLFSAIHNIAFGGAKRDWKTPFEENWGKAYILFVLGEILLVRQLSRSELVTSSAL